MAGGLAEGRGGWSPRSAKERMAVAMPDASGQRLRALPEHRAFAVARVEQTTVALPTVRPSAKTQAARGFHGNGNGAATAARVEQIRWRRVGSRRG